MKKTKKILSLVLALLMLVSVVPMGVSGIDLTLAPTGQCGDNAHWNFNVETGELIVSGSGDMYHYLSNSPFQYTSIKNIIIENGITSVGQEAFYGCDELESVMISDSVESISFYAFTRCYGLSNITVEKNNNYYSSENGVLFNKEKNKLIKYPSGKKDTNYKIPNSVTEIYADAFCDANMLVNITIPSSVTTIGDSAFQSCENLINVTIPDSVTMLGIYAFSFCTNLESLTIGRGINNISTGTFSQCINLKSVKLSNCIDSINSFAFYNCKNLSDIYYIGTVDQWNKIVVGTNNGNFFNATVHFISEDVEDKPITGATDNCSCNCHKGGIIGFFFKILNFFQKLFGQKKICECGAKH